MRNLYIRIMKNLINILLYKDYKSFFFFFPPGIFMPVYFSFFLALSLIIFENLVFLFFRYFSCIFSFYLIFSSSFLSFCFSQSAYFSNKKPPQPCRDDLYMYFLFLFFLLIFPETFFFFEVF